MKAYLLPILAGCLFAVMALGLAACGQTQDAPFTGTLGGVITPSPTGSPGSGGGGGTSSGGGAGSGSGSGSSGSSDSFATTDNGTVTLKQVVTLAINSNQTFEGLASDANNLYMLVYEQEGGGVDHYLFETLPNGASSWTTTCDILDDGNFSGYTNVGNEGLAWDGENFYIAAKENTPQSFRKFKASTCAEITALNTNATPDEIYLPEPRIADSYDSGNFFWYIDSDLYETNTSTGITNSWSADVSLGGQSLFLNNAFTVKNSVMWTFATNGCAVEGVFGCDSTIAKLWKLSVSGSKITPSAWGDMSAAFGAVSGEETTPITNTVGAITTQDNQTVVIAAPSISKNTVSFYYIDVSSF